jgi:hypothetical protein
VGIISFAIALDLWTVNQTSILNILPHDFFAQINASFTRGVLQLGQMLAIGACCGSDAGLSLSGSLVGLFKSTKSTKSSRRKIERKMPKPPENNPDNPSMEVSFYWIVVKTELNVYQSYLVVDVLNYNLLLISCEVIEFLFLVF